MPVCSENGGFTSEGRRILLNLVALNKEQPDWVPKFTEIGFEKVKIPDDLFTSLKAEQERLKSQMVVEGCAKAVINCEEILDNPEEEQSYLADSRKTFMMTPRQEVLDKMKTSLLTLGEEWSGINLEHTSTYGIRYRVMILNFEVKEIAIPFDIVV